jgi:hypothetical protein
VGELLSVVPIHSPIELRAASLDTACQGGGGMITVKTTVV